jgi:hypothetical protein
LSWGDGLWNGSQKKKKKNKRKKERKKRKAGDFYHHTPRSMSKSTHQTLLGILRIIVGYLARDLTTLFGFSFFTPTREERRR